MYVCVWHVCKYILFLLYTNAHHSLKIKFFHFLTRVGMHRREKTSHKDHIRTPEVELVGGVGWGGSVGYGRGISVQNNILNWSSDISFTPVSIPGSWNSITDFWSKCGGCWGVDSRVARLGFSDAFVWIVQETLDCVGTPFF